MIKKNILIIQVREGNAILSADGLADDDLVDVVELIPVLIADATCVSMRVGDKCADFVSRKRGSNLGPPGIDTFSACQHKKMK